MITDNHREDASMTHVATTRSVPLPREKRAEAKEFRLIFLASFALYLVAAVVSRLTPWRPARGRAKHSGVSIFGEARAAAYASIPLAFMS